jgi:restriction system protein
VSQPEQDAVHEISRLIEMPRGEFDELVANLYCALGHRAVRTNATGEHAINVVVQALNGQKWIVQCKQWRGAVGESVVREFYAAMQREQAAQGAIITTAKFTPKAREWAKGKPIHLYDGAEFLQAMKRIKSRAAQRLP